jgi:glycosyltransferase involved in cell wall biosynthesis
MAMKLFRQSLKMKNKPTIYYVVDQKGWVQHHRLKYLRKYQASFQIKILTAKTFQILWFMGFLREKFIFFSSWRIVHGFMKKRPAMFCDKDFGYMMAAVTSHSNIGGGLDPENPIPGRTPQEAYDLAIGLLRKFKVVTANSMILQELLLPGLPGVLYCPNGVDTYFFNPGSKKKNSAGRTIIGWVGKIRAPKNYDVVCNTREKLKKFGFLLKTVEVQKKFKKAPLSHEAMKDFYQNIDYYLCASWNEGTPNPALEAGACGVPVVTTCVGNMRELIEDGKNGFFVDPDADSIVACFKQLQDISREEYDALSSSMRERIEAGWSWEHRIKNFVKAFNSLVH